MPLILPAGMPAVGALRREGVTVIEGDALPPFAACVQPLTVALVNIMPDKPTTEIQFGRLLAGGDRPVRVIPALPDGYVPRTADPHHVARFYRPWSALDHGRLDGVIVTGAPVERLPFEGVQYWSGQTVILDWLNAARVPAIHVCWAAMAALRHDHGVPKRELERKRFGVYPHVPLDRRSAMLAGIPLPLDMPVSRWAEVRLSDLPVRGPLRALALAPVAGLGLAEDRERRTLYLLNHPEYDADTLDREYARDRSLGIAVAAPDAARIAARSWDATGRVLFRNWLAALARSHPVDRPDAALDLPPRIRAQGDAGQCSETRH